MMWGERSSSWSGDWDGPEIQDTSLKGRTLQYLLFFNLYPDRLNKDKKGYLNAYWPELGRIE